MTTTIDKPTTSQQNLVEWYNQAQEEKGLYDMKLFVSPDPDVSTSERSEEVLRLAKSWDDGRFSTINSDEDFHPKDV